MNIVKQGKRPSSDSFVDLHIFVVPHELWMEKYRTTYNNSTLESISAGFVRVAPALSLNDLRNQMKEQLGDGDVIPEDYVFLRCVGRCLAIVSKVQEVSLKVRHFVPPVVSSPEIFVLFGTHESLSHSLTSSLNTTSDLPDYVRGYITYSREMDDNSRCSTRSNTAGEISPENNDINDDTSSITEGRQVLNNSGRHVHFETNSGSGSGVKKGEVTEDVMQNKENTGRNEQQLKRKDIVQNYRETTETYLTELPQTSLEHRSEKDCPRSKETTLQDRQNAASLSVKENLQENRIEKMVRSRSSNQDSLSENPVEKKVNTSCPYKQDILSENAVEKKVRSSPSKQDILSENPVGKKVRSSPSKQDILSENRVGKKVNTSSPSKQQYNTTPFTRLTEDEQELIGEDDVSVNQSNKIPRKNPLIHSKTAPALFNDFPNETYCDKDKEDLDKTTGKTTTVKKKNEDSVVEKEGKKENHVRNNTTEEDGEIPKKNNHSNHPRSTNAAKLTIAPIGQGSNKETSDITASNPHKENDLPLTMANKKNLVLQLQAELHAVRSERTTSEKTREQLLKKAKNLQNQSNQKRTQARNIWKKKYFEEKKTTVSLEERCNQLRYEVDVLHKRLMSSVDSKDLQDPKHEFVHHEGDPDKVNNKILLSRKDNEVEELKRRVEEAKIKLGSEMKLRDTAQKELKHLRDEVIDKKINATLVKKSLSLLETRPSNI